MVSLLGAFALIVTTSLALLIAKRVNNAVHHLASSATHIAAGNLTQHIPVTGNDEFSDIAKYVNRIVTSFQEVISSNRHSVSALATAAEENAAVAMQTKQNIVEQQSQTQQIAARSISSPPPYTKSRKVQALLQKPLKKQNKPRCRDARSLRKILR